MQNLWGISFFRKSSKFHLDFKNAEKNREQDFCFWDNWISIGIFKFSLLRKGYLSLAANMLANSPKIWHVNEWIFFQLNSLAMYQSIWSNCCGADFNSIMARLPCCLSKVPRKRDFLDIYLTMFLESVISEIQILWGPSFFPLYSICSPHFKNSDKNSAKFFCFWYICIWIAIVNLSLLRTRSLSLAAYMLGNSRKIWHIIKRDFFQLNSLNSDQ